MFLLEIVVALIVIGVLGYWLLIVAGVVLAIIFIFWPMLLGAGLGIFFWKSGNADAAITVGVLSIFLEIGWAFVLSANGGTDYDNESMQGKRARYNADGDIIGYEDKD